MTVRRTYSHFFYILYSSTGIKVGIDVVGRPIPSSIPIRYRYDESLEHVCVLCPRLDFSNDSLEPITFSLPMTYPSQNFGLPLHSSWQGQHLRR